MSLRIQPDRRSRPRAAATRPPQRRRGARGRPSGTESATQVANFASNVAAVVSFALAGVIDYRLALPMTGAQALGGVIGARAAFRGGERLIRAAVLLVAAALSVRIAYQMLR
jgi:uncharacterized membrane protein YfcA